MLKKYNSVMLINRIKEPAKLEPYLIKNYAQISLLVAVGSCVYGMIIHYYNANAVEPKFSREIFSLIFLILAALYLTKIEKVLKYYEHFFFGLIFLFIHYLIYISYLNNFTVDYLLGTYITIFGSLLMLNSRMLIIIFISLEFIHIVEKVFRSNMDIISTSAVITSMGTILLFSFFMLTANLRQKKKLKDVNNELEEKVSLRTKDLEKRANELHEKNEDLRDFVYVISHDLKQPLKNIVTLSDWLIEENTGTINDKLKLIKTQVSQMYLLIEGILDYSLQNKVYGKITMVDINKLVKELITLNTANCVITIKNKLPKIPFNNSQMIQVFQNLIQNAIKYNDKKDIRIAIDYQEQEENHLFSVADNGIGIEKKYYNKIFGLFERLEVNFDENSTGIGLALVKKIITKNNGNIWVESELKVGTTFFFTLSKNNNVNV
ncbi:MAG: GHKL domain-containing protein [Flavobacteriaceae bacterium]|nr:MAG: GHKL domain-containing protein [Flavobacteriaceae bacterium]